MKGCYIISNILTDNDFNQRLRIRFDWKYCESIHGGIFKAGVRDFSGALTEALKREEYDSVGKVKKQRNLQSTDEKLSGRTYCSLWPVQKLTDSRTTEDRLFAECGVQIV